MGQGKPLEAINLFLAEGVPHALLYSRVRSIIHCSACPAAVPVDRRGVMPPGDPPPVPLWARRRSCSLG